MHPNPVLRKLGLADDDRAVRGTGGRELPQPVDLEASTLDPDNNSRVSSAGSPPLNTSTAPDTCSPGSSESRCRSSHSRTPP